MTTTTHSPITTCRTCWRCAGRADFGHDWHQGNYYAAPPAWAQGQYKGTRGYDGLGLCTACMPYIRAAIDDHGEYNRRDSDRHALELIAETYGWEYRLLPHDKIREKRATSWTPITLRPFAGRDYFAPGEPWQHLRHPAVADILNTARKDARFLAAHRCSFCGIGASQPWKQNVPGVPANHTICTGCDLLLKHHHGDLDAFADAVTTGLSGRRGKLDGAGAVSGWRWYYEAPAGEGYERFEHVDPAKLEARLTEHFGPERANASGRRLIPQAPQLPAPVWLAMQRAAMPVAQP